MKSIVLFALFIGSSLALADELSLRLPPAGIGQGEQLVISTNCKSDEFAELGDPIPWGDSEFRAPFECKPATCYYQKQALFPRNLFSDSWRVIRESGTKVSLHGGFRWAPGRVLSENLPSKEAARAEAERLANRGLCRAVKYSLPDTPSI